MTSTLMIGLLIPLLGTMLGSSFVFLMKDEMPIRLQKALLGFASGVMVAASVWSLLIPAMEMMEQREQSQTCLVYAESQQNSTEGQMEADSGKWAVYPAAVGFLLGMGFLLLIDELTPHLHIGTDKPEGMRSHLSKTAMLALAVTIHNLPEGGNSRWRSFIIGSLSGAVEPIGAIAVLLLASLLMPVLPYMLAFAAGAMFYVVVEELIPEASNGQHSNLSTIGFAIGFVLMMVLDVVMG